MLAARLHGPQDLRVERVPRPGAPGPGQVRLRVLCTGICGSDLHSYLDARIGDTPVPEPLILGHEFSAVVDAAGPEALDGEHQPLKPGRRVAVDPAQSCGRCEWCEKGHPNLCSHLAFCGNYPHGGSFCEWMHMPARSCFAVPAGMDDASAALLEPLGVAIHTLDFAKLRIGHSVAVLGAGPIGLLILQLARLAGADPIFVTDKLPWRLDRARHWGGVPIRSDQEDAARRVAKETHGRGVDVAIEAAWGDASVEEAAEMARLGGRLVLVGIPGDDRLSMKHSTARRKGLTVVLIRRMAHVYPRAMRLAEQGRVDLPGLVSHWFPLARIADAFALNTAYRDKVLKVMVRSGSGR
ncbi:MAG: alcohol dehydrogenase catalytic domain-containing protein [Verrucomicrobia bacterium]|nr:alcohol dehydrogenase catalytic domain-containing protein [Verrucomicrobiota bacterium]